MRNTLLFLGLFLSIIATTKAQDNQTKILKAELLKLEQKKPREYLKLDNVELQPQSRAVRNGGLFNGNKYYPNGAIIAGNIINKATIAKFQDVVLKILYYSKTNTLIGQKSYVIYEYYEPQTTKHFSIRVDVKDLPQAYENYDLQIIGAKPSQD